MNPFALSKADVDDQKNMLAIVEHLSSLLELEGTQDRIVLFKKSLGIQPTYRRCHEEWHALRGQIEEEVGRRHIFYIGKNRAAPLLSMSTEWETVLSAFAPVRTDIESGIRCFAFEQYTASVFHMMRVAEYGLRIVAKERKLRLSKDRPIDVAQWSDLTNRLKIEVEKVSNWPARKKEKVAALAFYTGIHADVVFFKDRYRNLVSHSLVTFHEREADSVIRRVREFMTGVSLRLDSDAKRIPWK